MTMQNALLDNNRNLTLGSPFAVRCCRAVNAVCPRARISIGFRQLKNTSLTAPLADGWIPSSLRAT